jgi:uncharacterized protein
MRFIVIFLLCLVISTQALALDLPALRGHVNDYAAMLSPERAAALEQQLSAFEQSDSTQIVVLTVPTLGNENLEEFSIKVAESWKIGQKGVDNGVILLVAKAERKVRIEVGRGLEGKLTDLVSGRIIRADITPKFKAGDFDGGIAAGVNALIEVAKGEYKAAPRDLHQGKKGAPPLLTLLVFLAVAAVFLSSFSRYLSGAVGAIGLPIIAWLTFPGLALAIIAGLAVGGFLLGLFLAFLFGGGGGGGYFGGPFFGGGFYGGGGGGGDSGGFSGGGGDFGGGGASGDW